MDIRLAYSHAGAGENLILLHGNGENRFYFKHQMSALSELFHVYAVDTRGHGDSERGQAPFTLEQFSEDLHDFMNLHRIRKAHILGFSDGANTAMVFAMRYPECVDRLILNGGNMHPWGVKWRYQIPIVLEDRICKCRIRKSESARRKHEFLNLMTTQPQITPSMLRNIAAPTLVVAGKHDMIRLSETKRIAQSIPNSKLVLLPGNHFVALQNPQAFNQTVIDFLKGGEEVHA